MSELVVSPFGGSQQEFEESLAQANTRDKRLKQRMLARSRQGIASTPNVLGGGVMGRKAPSGPTTSKNLLNSINSMPSLLGDM